MGIGKQNEHGWSLIEIVAVILVAAIILPALILPFVEGVRGLDIPVISGNLAFLAQEEMEKNVVCFNYQSVVNWGGWTDSAFPAPFATYSSSCSIANTSFGPVVTDVALITVTVTHDDGQSLSLITVKTNWN
ncbi:MAG: hypothetical protein U9N73_08270 [Candidatus Auribacterota bacterium]|nr:hypothetical protein [Candidatus Auribacterota bacterium]